MNTFTTKSNLPDDVWASLFLHYSHIPNTNFLPDQVKKRMGLKMIGCSESEIEDLCRPREMDLEEWTENFKKQQEQELKYLAVLNKQRVERSAKSKKCKQVADLNKVPEIFISDKDLEWLKRLKEQNSEYWERDSKLRIAAETKKTTDQKLN